MNPRIARKWHKPVQNAISWEKNAKVEDYAGFWAFCRKKHEIFTNPVFKNPGRCIYIYISSWICKNIAARISLEAGRSPASSQCGRLKPRGLNVKASIQTQPRYWPVGGWVARCCVSKAQPVGRVVFGHLFYTLNVVLNNC